MNISRKNVDESNAVISIRLEKNDYEGKVNTALNDYRRKARIDGFRPGKVPLGLITKMYRKPLMLEEINKLISESLSKYIANEKLHILGEPIPNNEDRAPIDLDNGTDFEFKFDIGLSPELDIKISNKDKVPSYQIKADDELVKKYIDSYSERLGEFENVDEVTEKDLVKASVKELDANGNPLNDGVSVDEATLSVEMTKDKGIKKQFLSLKKGDTLAVDLKKAYPNDTEIAGILKIDKEKVTGLGNLFQVTVNEISRFRKAAVDQALFDKVFGEGTVKSEKEFKLKVAEEAAKGLKQDSEYRLRMDMKDLLLKKFKGELPAEFLKRWLLLINEGKFTREQIDTDYGHFEEDLKWQLIKDRIISDNKLEVTEEDVQQSAIDYTRIQFSRYGLSNLSDEHLKEFAKRMLEKEEDKKNIVARAVENKIFEFVKTVIKIEEKEITAEKFNKLFEK